MITGVLWGISTYWLWDLIITCANGVLSALAGRAEISRFEAL